MQNVCVQALVTIGFVLLGPWIGSFLNVCIDRLPGGRSIVFPPSRCDQCERRLAVGDLIPVFSYLWLRGRCRYCGAVLPKRLVVVELASGAMLGALYLLFGLEPEFGVAAFWGCLFIVIFVIDLEQGLVLNKIVYPSLLIALLFAALVGDLPWLEGIGAMEDWPQIAIAALGGGLGFLLFLVLALFAVAILHKEGLGGGDVKLAALLGLVCGFPLVLLVIVLGAIVGLLMALLMGRFKGGETIPFGSALVVATLIAMVAGQSIIDWLARLYS
ncbi:MAG: prepilin peptidase [Dehalococcoidia bacterium]|nr:prepilin peptidase [Dehalococcoidia bacterium]